MKVSGIQHLGGIAIIGILVGLCSWVIEAAIHAYVLREGSLGAHVFYPALPEVWHRLAMAVGLVGLGAYAQSLLGRRRRAEEAYRQSEERFRNIFETVNDGILIADIATQKFVEVNKAMCDMLGYRREEVLGLGIGDIHPPEDLPLVLSEFQRAIRDDEKLARNLPVLRKDGTIFRADICHTTISLNSAPCAVGIVRDITERSRAEEETERLFKELASKALSLKGSEARFRSIAETSIDVIYRLDPKGMVTYASPAIRNVLGFTEEEVAGRFFLAFVHGEDKQKAQDAFAALLRGEQIKSRDLRVMTRDDGHIHAEINVVPLFDDNHAVAGIHGIIHDISERIKMDQTIKRVNQDLEHRIVERTAELEETVRRLNSEIAERTRTEATLRESWIKFRQLAEHIREVFWIRDIPSRQVLYISPAYEELWGRTCQSLYDRPDSFLECVHPDDAAHVAASVARLRDGCAFDEEYRIVRPDGSVRWVWARSFSITNEQGEVSRIVGLAEDITDRRNSDQILRTHADQLQALSSRLIEAREAERQFIARELHDEIGQQLTGIKITLDMMRRSAPVALTAQLHDAQTLVGDLLKRVRDLSLDLRPSMLDDLGLLPALTWHFERYRNQTGINVAFTHEGLGQRLGPAVEITLYRVIQESLTNVARHAGAKEVSVSLSSDRTGLLLSVSDNGAGFDPAEVRCRTMGLFGMRERIEAVGGRLAIQSSRGAGTLVTATVPLRDGAGGEA